MAASLNGVYPTTLQDKIKNAKLLVIGAGGIGCEVLKNLVLSGFQDIEIIDLDTIDLSNLNRQFLFHREHVGKSKAQVARESALLFNPDVKILAHHDSIMSTEYGVNYFKKFDVVLSALDNRAARNHVNRMCLNADVPLIESGTSGYDGQVELIKKGLTQCYECSPKAAQKTFPGCTIRNTPSEPIHCIVWAKHLFNQLFGESVEDEDISPDMADPEAAAAGGGDDAEGETKATDTGNVERISTRQWAKDSNYDAEKLFNKFFFDDINYLLSMSNLWKKRKPPAPVEWKSLITELDEAGGDASTAYMRQYHKVWTLVECANVFAKCLKSLSTDFLKLDKEDSLVWDKDDQPAMDFVAACANLRGYIFEIERKSRFEIKSMAGNIIPAIATTNAITAGISIMRVFDVLRGQLENCKSVYVRLRQNVRQRFIVPDLFLVPPNPNCIVCSTDPAIHLRVDTKRLRIKEFRDEVLIKKLNMINPDVTNDAKGTIIISSEEGETECNESKLLSELDIVDGVLLKVDDFFQNYELRVIIVHFDAEHDEPLFEVIADKELLKPKESSEAAKDDDENQKSGVKRNGTANIDAEDGPSTSKKSRLVDDDDDDDDCQITSDIMADEKHENEIEAATSKTENMQLEQNDAPKTATKRKPSIGDQVTIIDSDDDDQVAGPTKSKRTRHETTAMETINID